MKSLVKLAIVVAIAWMGWNWYQKQERSRPATAGAAEDACPAAAESASNDWGGGIGRFANPPYDLAAWDEFRSRVERQIRDAEGKCSCASDSCTNVKAAMSELRALVRDLDTSIRGGAPPPSDIVQRQESIDNAISAARARK